FCKVRGSFFTHKISKIRGKQYQISNNHKHVNGWITRNSIYGIVTKIW
ncbi:phage repressor protein, partial [Escherichia coli]|nr:phage repressor protein [Escherichia coli]